MAVKQLRIHGRVQGVGFRWSLAHEARRLDITGWVRNRRDGTVEALIAGSAEAVETLIDWARRGPPGARVSQVEIGEAAGDFPTFEQWPTV